MKNSSKVYSRDSLLRNVWGSGIHVVARTVDVHIRKLREKIGENFGINNPNRGNVFLY